MYKISAHFPESGTRSLCAVAGSRASKAGTVVAGVLSRPLPSSAVRGQKCGTRVRSGVVRAVGPTFGNSVTRGWVSLCRYTY